MSRLPAAILIAVICLMTTRSVHEVRAEQVNAVSLEQGAVLRSYTSEYGGRGSDKWIALALIDGSETVGWSSAKGQAAPNTFLFELATDYALSSLAFDNRYAEETSYPGIAARRVSVSVSATGAANSFVEIFNGPIGAQDVTSAKIGEPVTARWISLTILDNGGYGPYTELMEFSAFGAPTRPRLQGQSFQAVFNTNWGPFFLTHDEGELRGCYDHDNGRFAGADVDGVMNIEWRENGDQTGSAVLAISEDGSAFNGFWYVDGALRGTWSGQRAADGSRRPACAPGLISPAKSHVAQSLDDSGSARLYGIYFDFDSDVIKPESARTLGDVLSWLTENPSKTVIFEGHTDSKGDDAYNQTLSSKRAVAVSNWLVSQGIADNRLASVGMGESRPVADNATANGRSLNRRVEIRIQ